MNKDNVNNSRNQQLRHGHVCSPASRAYFAWQENMLDEGQLNQCEAGKFFPATQEGLTDSFAHEDIKNDLPPPDGKIASANQSKMEFLDVAGNQWKKHDVQANTMFEIEWRFTANHITRRFNYFMTKADWNSSEVLSRKQFEFEPIHTEQYDLQPFWAHSEELKPHSPTKHTFLLPNREGYHVLLAVWEVADTANAFYQVIDLNFLSDGNTNQRPSTPTDVKVTEKTEKSISLSWGINSTTESLPIQAYRIVRDGVSITEIESSKLTYTDLSVQPNTTYNYHVIAIDIEGNTSLPSASIEVTTPSDGSGHISPTAPKNLHAMSVASPNSIDLMWLESTSTNAIKQYHIYRDGIEVGTTDELNWKDTGLQADTTYQYFVAAETISGEFSVPSNIIFSTTSNEESGTAEWALNTSYKVNDVVTYQNKTYRCIQAHTSNSGWAPGVAQTLWQLTS